MIIVIIHKQLRIECVEAADLSRTLVALGLFSAIIFDHVELSYHLFWVRA